MFFIRPIIKISITVFLFLLLLFVSPVFGQTAIGISITPHIIDETARARNNFKYSVIIKNNTDRQASLYATVNDISITEGRQEFIEPSKLDKTTSLARWILVSRGRIELKPGDEVEVPLEVEVNMYAIPGKRYATISFPQGNNRQEAENNVAKNQTPQVLLSFDIIEEIIEKAQVKKFNTDKNVYLEMPVTFSFEITNNGNRNILPEGSIYIYNRRSVEIDKITIKAGDFIIEPQSTSNVDYNWENSDDIGKFKARLELEYGQTGSRDLQDTIYFWVLPLPYLISFIVGIFVILIFLAIFLYKKLQYHQNSISASIEREGVIDLKNKR